VAWRSCIASTPRTEDLRSNPAIFRKKRRIANIVVSEKKTMITIFFKFCIHAPIDIESVSPHHVAQQSTTGLPDGLFSNQESQFG
jgi:hypothetical protein